MDKAGVFSQGKSPGKKIAELHLGDYRRREVGLLNMIYCVKPGDQTWGYVPQGDKRKDHIEAMVRGVPASLRSSEAATLGRPGMMVREAVTGWA